MEDRKNPFFHFTTVFRASDNGKPFFHMKKDKCFRIHAKFFKIFIGHIRSIDNGKAGLKIVQFSILRSNKHIMHKMGLPGLFCYDPDIQ